MSASGRSRRSRGGSELRLGATVVLASVSVILASPSRASASEQEGERSRLILGGRVGTQAFHFDESSSALSGVTFQGDLGVQISPRYAVYGFLQSAVYDTRSDRIAQGPLATGHAVGVGLQVSTNPEGTVSFLIDLGAGYRWIHVPFDTGKSATPYGADRYAGWEPLRLHAGPTLQIDGRLRAELLFGGALGRFSGAGHAETCAIVATCRDSILVDGDTQSATYFTLDVALALHTWM